MFTITKWSREMNTPIVLTQPPVYLLFATCVLLMPAALSAQNANAKVGAPEVPRMPDGKLVRPGYTGAQPIEPVGPKLN